MKYLAAIFDLDGTVLDTLGDLADAVNHSLEKNGLPQRSLREVRSFVGNGIRLLIERAVAPSRDAALTDAVYSDFCGYYAVHCADKTAPYPGINDMLAALKRSGVRTALVSNKADFAVQTLVEDYFPGLFDYAVGERPGVPRKPAPDSVSDALRALGVAARDALYIGDSDVDVATAANAGLDMAAVTWGFRDEDFLRERGAELFVRDPSQLAELILTGRQ